MTETLPPDQAQRDRVTGQLDATLFVEAGAGSGKTTALVERIVNLVLDGVELRSIAAITFTEKAGAELRDRLRRAIETRAIDLADVGAAHADADTAHADAAHADAADVDAAHADVGAAHADVGAAHGDADTAHGDAADGEAAVAAERVVAAERCRAALDQLDGAAISTLHSFAQRILAEHPIEAGLPPRIEVLDEVSSGLAFERRWARFQEQLLADPSCERTILLLLAAGVRTGAFRALARAFDQSWDLVVERVPSQVEEPPTVASALTPVVELIRDLCRQRANCRDGEDKFAIRLDEIDTFVDDLMRVGDEIEQLDLLRTAPSFRARNIGKGGNWGGQLDDLRDDLAEAGEKLAAVAGDVAQACAHRLGAAISRFTLEAAIERRQSGQLEFHDLLVLARGLLRDPDRGPEVRADLHRRYQRLLLDEFQDTDPIQVELAVRIAAADPASPAAGADHWSSVAVAPGHIFLVGDPKQSIYRFRRADIALFLEARDRFGSQGNGVAQLTANFRTGAPVIDWVNQTFAALMSEPPEHELELASQPEYVALSATRGAATAGPAVAVLGRDAHPRSARAPEVRAAEASDVAGTIARILAEGWTVAERLDGGSERWRPARLGDICVLVPARTSLPFLDDALAAANIPYRAESSSIVYATGAIRDLLMVARAIDDPTDSLRLVAALRTPLFGLGDDDLARFRRERGGRFHLGRQHDEVPEGDPVAAALGYLGELSRQRRWLTPADVLDRIARDRRALELGFAEGRPRDVWRRHRFVIDQARAWHEATGGNLREYLAWVAQQTSEGARVAESVLPETDDDAVRVMTIHAAKGLEFPITIVSGLSSLPSGRQAPAEVRFPPGGGVAYRLGPRVVTTEFSASIPLDEQMGLDERIRLLYVATTRARDHLVVSLHRAERAKPPAASRRTNAELLVAGIGDALAGLPDAAPAGHDALTLPAGTRPGMPAPFDEWLTARADALAGSGQPTTVAATALTDDGHAERGEPDPGLQKRPRDLDLPPWLKGRYGTAVGRAVHGVLQTIDLAGGTGLDDAVAAQCEAEAVGPRAATVRSLVEAALASDVVQAAAAAPHWRELYACTPVAGGRMLEGYVDLLYRSLGGLVVVDYKTAATSDRSELEARVAGYRLQGASYALAVGEAAAEPVHQVVFLFLTPTGALPIELADLAGAVAEVRSLVTSGRERELVD